MFEQQVVEFRPERVLPPAGTKARALLTALSAGQRHTVASALTMLGIYALSQECGRLRARGWPVLSEWIKTEGGAHVKRFYLGKP